MADLSDILGKKPREPINDHLVEVNGMCHSCFWPISHGFYNDKEKKLRLICVEGHENVIDWIIKNG